MAIEYTETDALDDPRGEMLDDLCDGKPWVLICADTHSSGEGLALKLEMGGGISDTPTALSLLVKAARALEEGAAK